MSTITQKLESTQINLYTSPQDAATASLIPKQLPGSIISRISSFTSYDELSHTSHLVCKRCPKLPIHVLNLNNSQITDKELIEIIEKEKNSLTHIKLSNCPNITDLSLKHFSKLQNLIALDLSECDKISDAGAKDLSKLQNLTALNLRGCYKITDAGAKDLSKLQNLTELDLSRCDKITDIGAEGLINLQHLTELELGNSTCTVKELDIIRQMYAEKTALNEFINEKSKKIGPLKCNLQFKDEHAMKCSALPTGFQITSNFLYLLAEKNMDSFLLQNPDHLKSVSTFLIQKKPELLNQAAVDLIEWFNSYKFYNVAITDDNKILAKELLIMHAIGKLSAMKRFLLTHEMGHAHDHDGRKSLGDFDPLEFNFIKSNQFEEVRADLTAAREENAHELGIAYFQWRSIIAGWQDENASHPTDKNRATVLKIDIWKIYQDKMLKRMTTSIDLLRKSLI